MKKLLTFFLTALLAFGVGWAGEVTISMSQQGWTSQTNITAPVVVTSGDVTLTFTKGTNNPYFDGTNLRIYKTGGSMTVEANGNTITSIVITGSSLGNLTAADGSFPSNATSRTWSGSVTSETFTASGTTSIATVTVTYSGTATCATPTFLPVAGTYDQTQNVTISCATSGATIYYTTDGTTPTTSSSVYSSPIEVSSNTTIKAFAAKSGLSNSSVATAEYVIVAPAETVTYEKVTSTSDLTDGDYLIVYGDGSCAFDGRLTDSSSPTLDATGNFVSVTISNNIIETNQAIYFTYDATAGTLKSASGYYIGRTASSNGFDFSRNTQYKNTITITSGNAIITGCDANGNATTAKLQCWVSGSDRRFRYYTSSQKAIQLYKKVGTPKVATPTFSPAAGTYTSAQSVEISCDTQGATIYYTTDGSTPTTSSSVYSSAINVNSTTTIKAIAVKSGMDDSEVATATYTINLTSSLTALPATVNINDDNTSGARTGSFTVTGANLGTGNVGVTRTNNKFTPYLETTPGSGSATNASTYWFFTPDNSLEGTVAMTYNGHALSATTAVNLANAEGANHVSAAVNVNYLYTGPIYLYGNIGPDASSINNFNYTNGVAMTRNIENGTYSVNITAVKESDNNPYAWMYFSKNQGTELDALSTKFGPISNESYWPLQGDYDLTGVACALDTTLEGSNAKTIRLNPGEYTVEINPHNNTFTISALVHAPVISLANGTYEGAQTVTITSQTPGATIYYTTDGTTPTTSSNSIANGGTVTISQGCTLKAIAVSNGVLSAVTEATYVIIAPFESKDYEMVTNVSDLVANQTYLIVYKTADDATSATVMGPVSSNIGTTVSATESNAGLITSTNAMAVVTLAGSTGNWTLATSQGILRAEDANNLYVDNTPHTWTIDKVSSNVNTFAIQSNAQTNRYLQYNSSSTRFACYKTSSNQQYVYIYRESTTPAIVVTQSDGSTSIEVPVGVASATDTIYVHGRNLTGAVTLTLSAEDQAKGFSLFNSLSTYTISQADALAGDVPVEVTYSGSDASATATIILSSAGATNVTVPVTATREALTVTISPASCNFVGSVMSEPVTITANAPGATIEYSLDGGTTWQTYTEGITITIEHPNNSVTVMARATLSTGGNTYTSETVSETYTRQPKGATLFEKVTDESQIKANEKYIIVYEGTKPAVFNGIFSESSTSTYWGSRVEANWKTQNQVVDISGTDALVFTLGSKNNKWTLNCSSGYLEAKAQYAGLEFLNDASSSSSWQWNTISVNDGYGLTTGSTYYLRYNAGNNNGNVERGPFRLYDNQTTGSPAYLYVLRPAVLAPEITPATGEYSGNQRVEITAEPGVDIYYTTDGTDPTSNSTPYEGPFNALFDSNGPTTIKAIAIDDEGNVSTIASVIYTWVAPKVTIRPATRDVYNNTLTVVIGSNPVDATIYYTTDGTTPSDQNGTLYEGPFEVTFANLGDQVTVKAIAYNNANIGSTVDVATYTYTTKVIDVAAPFFSPLEGSNGGYSGVYYGEQTLQIASETENADIYYVIEDVTGTTPPSSVSDPTNASTHYTGPITMQVGHSYRVKAIAYIGDFHSTVSEGYYTILEAPTTQYTYTNLKDFNDNCPTGVAAHFVNPVQVVFHSTYTNKDGEWPEFCYVRDNTDYACVYFGKRNTGNYTVFEMGDWIDGSLIAGTTNIWDRNFHIQMGTQSHSAITSWPTTALGNSEILPEEITNATIVAGTATGSNSWGHYVHLRNTTLRDVQDYESDDPKHTGKINDGTADAYYYDKFYRWSAGTCKYESGNTTYSDVINCLGDYDQAFFTAKQNAGATFDVYGIVDYYKPYNPPFEMCPIDFLWVYKPVITPATNLNCTSQQVVDITVETPEWDGATTPTIYYKTDDMEDWEEFIGPFIVNSDTHVQAYAELPSTFEDMMRSDIVEATYEFTNIKDPIITSVPDENVILVQTGNESVTVTIETNPESPDATTLYTTNGEVPTLDNGTEVTNGEITLDPITETTTVTAISYIEVSDGQGGTTILWSNPVTETYTFVKSNGVVYDLVNAVQTGMVYVIVNKDANMGLSTTQNATNRASTGVMFTDNTKEHVYGNDELALFVLESANAGRYYFKNINGGGYLTVTTNDYANLNTSAATSSYSQAAVAFGTQADGYPATITFNYDGTNRYLRYFAKGRTFTTNSDATLNEDVFLYGTSATPLAVIESEEIASPTNQVTVADDLIGTWAVDNGTEKYLWAKDMGFSIDKTTPVTGQTDYVMDVLGWQNDVWDQSNWVIIDFANSALEPGDFVGKKIAGGTLTGLYVEGKNNGGNYRIVLESQITPANDADAVKYPGLGLATQAIAAVDGKYNPANYALGYNTYVTANFNTDNLNAPYGNGFVAGDDAATSHQGEKLFFMNPKTQEVARVWGVWDGTKFTVWQSDQQHVNGWAVKGAFDVNWSRNARSLSPLEYGQPEGINNGTEHIFHAVVALKQTSSAPSGAPRRATPDDQIPASDEYEIYPLDLSNSGNPTAVKDVQAGKTVVSVRYYNVMGMESEKPFEGINIVVTRFNDGSVSTVKVLR